jgi:putative membrane protein
MLNNIKDFIIHILKGMGMGAANVIPGVSGGTIALITGIFERIINAIKSIDIVAFRLLFKGKIKELLAHVDFYFLLAVFVGMLISVISLARLFEFLFQSYPVYIWSFFFGLILASIFFVGKTIGKWSYSVILTFVLGAAIAIWVSFMNPASPNDSFFYLMLCGVVAICSMILPGLSGSFVLILMGNYELVMIDAVNDANFKVLLPAILGGIIGIVAFSHLLSWIYGKYKDQTISTLTGFILGSLSILWPWKNAIYRVDSFGEFILKKGEKIVQGYKLYIPDSFSREVLFALLFIALGIATITLIEKLATRNRKS